VRLAKVGAMLGREASPTTEDKRRRTASEGTEEKAKVLWAMKVGMRAMEGWNGGAQVFIGKPRAGFK
jgi:hypothetical protein